MAAQPTLRISLEVERDVRPIAGAVVTGNGGERRFEGWIQLMSLLEDALDPGARTRDTHEQGRQ